MKKKILVFCDFYLPGLKSGGGMWTVVHLINNFADSFDFFVVTRNYESKGDRQPYTAVKSGAWNAVGNARVFYLANEDFRLATFVSIIADVKPDAVFLNSAFSLPVVRFLTVRRKKLIAPVPVLLAPCGEMSANARSVKALKKKLFLFYAKSVGLYKDLIWKASSEHEKSDIRTVIGTESEVHVAPDLLPQSLPDFDFGAKPGKRPGEAKLIFLSRIVTVKNLMFLLERLRELRSGSVTLEIVGPVEDSEYWERCRSLIKELPRNISILERASFVPPDVGQERMLDNHFFVLPTLTENFGYVIFEALSAGCPLVISDHTQWNRLSEFSAGWELTLAKPQQWNEVLRTCVEMDQEQYREMSLGARSYAVDWVGNNRIRQQTEALLEKVVAGQNQAGRGKP